MKRRKTSTIAASWPSSRALTSRSSAASLRASAAVSDKASRMATNARTTNTLIWTARGLLSTVAAMSAPCSVNTKGRFLRPPCADAVTICDRICPKLEVTNCDFKLLTSCSVS